MGMTRALALSLGQAAPWMGLLQPVRSLLTDHKEVLEEGGSGGDTDQKKNVKILVFCNRTNRPYLDSASDYEVLEPIVSWARVVCPSVQSFPLYPPGAQRG